MTNLRVKKDEREVMRKELQQRNRKNKTKNEDEEEKERWKCGQFEENNTHR